MINQSVRSQRGMVTFELAVGVLAAAMLAVMLGWGISLLALQAQCTDSAAQIARHLGRGDSSAADEARSTAPAGAHIAVSQEPTTIRVDVTFDARLGSFGPVPLRGSAVVPRERP